MNDQPETKQNSFTLIDVMTGMEALSLNTALTPPCFKFFWGLVMLANRLTPRFKNPFNLTVEQATGVGGGSTRQSVNQKQHALNDVRIDGGKLICIKPGNKKNNTAANYKINYKMIIAASPVSNSFTSQPSINGAKPLTVLSKSVDGTVDDLDPFLRSEQNREDNNRGVAVENSGQETNLIRTINGDITILSSMICGKWHGQLTAAPSYSLCRQAIEAVDGDIDKLLDAVNRAPDILKHKTPEGALSFIVKIAKNNWYVPKPIDDFIKPPGELPYEEKMAQFHERDIQWLNNLYHDYKDGELPTGALLPIASIHFMLTMKLPEVERFADEINFTMDQFKAAMKLWEGRE